MEQLTQTRFNKKNVEYSNIASPKSNGQNKQVESFVEENGKLKYKVDGVNKEVGGNTQFEVMPPITPDLANKIVQYVGADTNEYKNGYFYKAVDNAWVNIKVQESASGLVVIEVGEEPLTAEQIEIIKANKGIVLIKMDGAVILTPAFYNEAENKEWFTQIGSLYGEINLYDSWLVDLTTGVFTDNTDIFMLDTARNKTCVDILNSTELTGNLTLTDMIDGDNDKVRMVIWVNGESRLPFFESKYNQGVITFVSTQIPLPINNQIKYFVLQVDKNTNTYEIKEKVHNIYEDVVLYTEQNLTEEQKAQVRANIGAGASGFSGDFSDLKNVPTASETTQGIIQIASDTEASNGTDTLKAINSKQLKSAIESIGTVFNLKGTKALYNQLPLTDNKKGDVWYVVERKVGYIWLKDTSTGTLDDWEEFGKPIDLSGYVQKTDIVDGLTSTATDKPLSANQGKELDSKISNILNNTSIISDPSTGGFRAGKDAVGDGAIGQRAKSLGGGAIGLDSLAGVGFSGGARAQVIVGADGIPIDAIQLGSGTNKEERTLRVYSHTVMNEDGTLNSKGVKVATDNDIPKYLYELSGDTTHRTVTDAEKSTWNNKSDFDGNYNNLSNKPTIPTNNNQLTNGAGYITANDIPEQIPTYVKDIGNSTNISFRYSSGGNSNPDYFAVWNGYQITYISKADAISTLGINDKAKQSDLNTTNGNIDTINNKISGTLEKIIAKGTNYIKYDSGIMLQFIEVTGQRGKTTSHNFIFPFKSGTKPIIMRDIDATSAASTTVKNIAGWTIKNPTNTGFQIYTSDIGGISTNYIFAIGYWK